MAQELASGTRNATRASDVFSLGIIAFELLTGKRAFPEAPVTAKLEGRPLPLPAAFRAACPTLPAGIAALLDAAMSHDPRLRPTAKELAVALREAVEVDGRGTPS
jgi:serine/threonine-protein kinase